MHKLFSKGTINIDYILCGIYIYYLGYLFYNFIFKDMKWVHIFTFIGVCFIFWGFLNIRKTLKGCDSGIMPIYVFFVAVCLINVIIGVPQMIINDRMYEIITSQQTTWMYLIGLAFLIPVKIGYVRQIIRWSLLYVLTSLVFSLYYFTDLFINASVIFQSYIGFDAFLTQRPQEPAILLFPIAAFFIFIRYFSPIWQLTIKIMIPMSILSALLAGRRSITIMMIAYLLIYIYVSYKDKIKSRWRGAAIVFLFAVVMMVVYESESVVEKYIMDNFVVMYERIGLDTRADVNNDFYKDMKDLTDLVVGRGMAGTYRSINLADVDNLQRKIVETGFLNIILHGGILMLIPYLLLLVYAFLKGYFYSHNYFLKSCALFVLCHIVFLYQGGNLRLTLEYFILFVFVRICLTPRWRSMSNKDVHKRLAKSIMS